MVEGLKVLWEASQQASPALCFMQTVALVVIWRQMRFDRAEHRKSENGFTAAVLRHAKASEKIANALNRLSNRSSRVK